MRLGSWETCHRHTLISPSNLGGREHFTFLQMSKPRLWDTDEEAHSLASSAVLPSEKNQCGLERKQAHSRNPESLKAQSGRDKVTDRLRMSEGPKRSEEGAACTFTFYCFPTHSPGCTGLPMEDAGWRAWFPVVGSHLANRQHRSEVPVSQCPRRSAHHQRRKEQVYQYPSSLPSLAENSEVL